jgi:hypothetical protein
MRFLVAGQSGPGGLVTAKGVVEREMRLKVQTLWIGVAEGAALMYYVSKLTCSTSHPPALKTAKNHQNWTARAQRHLSEMV